MSSVDSAVFQRVQHYAAYHDFDTAIFIAEQLFAAFKQKQQKQQQQTQQTQLSAILSSYLPAAFQPHSTETPALLHPLVILLAQCYINSGPSDLPRAYHLLSSTLTSLCPTQPTLPLTDCEPQHRYLLALVCSRTEQLQEAELCLLPLLSHPSFSSLPTAACCLSLLGAVCQRTGRVDESIDYHSRALELDGLLWSSYAALCQLGVNVEVGGLFSVDVSADSRPALVTSLLPSHCLHSSTATTSSQSAAVHTPLPSLHAATVFHTDQHSQLTTSTPASAAITPRPKQPPTSSSSSHIRTPSSSSQKASHKRPTTATTATTTPLAAGQQRLTFHSTKLKKDTTAINNSKGPPVKPHKPATARSELTELASGGRGVLHSRTKSWSSVTPLTGVVRKRLDEVVEMEAADTAGGGGTSSGGLAEEGAENEWKEDRAAVTDPVEAPVQQSDDEASGDELRRQDVLVRRSAANYTSHFRTLASAHSALLLCHPRVCIRLLTSLPFDYAHTPFALSSLARAHFDLVDYPTALRYWQQLRTLHPHHLYTVDLYSTALWQCKRDTLLASLAHSLTPHHSTHPVTAIVLGNTFSLQREHDTALRFFRRAVQLDGRYAYGWVLIGHECVVLEEWERAIEAYRRAIGEDGRMYGGWYGLGQVYYQQEKWQTALYHFNRALTLNSQSPLLRVYVAMTHVQLQQLDDALTVLLDLDSVQQAEDDMAAAALPNPTHPTAGHRTPHTVHPQVQYQLANIYVLREEWQAALAACERLLSVVWREASVYVLMGRVYRALGEVEAAMRCWVMAMELDVKDSNGVKGMMEAMCKREARRKNAVSRGEQLVEEVEEQEMDVGY